MARRELLIGCGSRSKKILHHPEHPNWEGLVRLDIESSHKPDVVWDLESPEPLPFADDEFDELHAIEVLEHTGRQGDYRFFFRQFSEFWRVLKPNGSLFATSPSLSSRWLWGDPGHTRVIAPESLVFLSQPEYTRQVGNTPMTDYRSIYQADFDIIRCDDGPDVFAFALQAVKPSRIDHGAR